MQLNTAHYSSVPNLVAQILHGLGVNHLDMMYVHLHTALPGPWC